MKPEYRRKQIMAVAKKVFASQGYHRTNIEKICTKAGTARGTIYRYFKNKEDLFAAILEDTLEQMNQDLMEQYDLTGFTFATREQILEAYIQTSERVFSVWLADRDFARIAMDVSAGVSKRFTEVRQEYDRRNLGLIKAMLDRFKENEMVRKDLDTELVAIRLRGAMEKINTTYIFDQKRKFTLEEIRELARKNAELDLYGILTPELSAATAEP